MDVLGAVLGASPHLIFPPVALIFPPVLPFDLPSCRGAVSNSLSSLLSLRAWGILFLLVAHSPGPIHHCETDRGRRLGPPHC